MPEITEGTVDIPQVGRVKKEYLWIGGGIVAIIVGVAYWKRRQAAANAGPILDTTNGSLGATGGTPPPVTPAQTTGSTLPTTNQQWTLDVLDKMGVVGGTEESHILSVIGKYLNRVALTADEADIIRQAWALSGKPPEGPDNFTLTTTGSTTGTPPPGGTSSPPGPVTGLHQTAVGPDFIAVAWSPVDGATGYHLIEQSPYGHTDHGTVSGTAYTVEHLAAPDTDHRIIVSAKNSAGEGPSTNIIVHTTGRFIGPRPPAGPF